MLFNTDILAKVRGVSWEFEKDYLYNTIVQRATNGKTQRVALWSAPLWQFAYKWNYVKDWPDDKMPAATFTDMQQLLGQLLPLLGEANEFDYAPTDSVVTGQQLFPDTLGNAQVVHSIGGFLEPVQDLAGGNITHLYYNGTLQAGPYAIFQPSSVAPYLGYVLPSMPTDGTVVTVDFTYYYRCQLDLKNQASSNMGNSHTHGFMTIAGSALSRMLFEAQEVAFSQVRI
jgi:hypothetical protein